jgi:hypothetical protein
MLDLEEIFKKYEDDHLEFQHVANKLSNRPDLHAFILLDKLVPSEKNKDEDMIGCAEHDEIWLNVDPKKLAEVAKEEDILNLIRCGVRYGRYDNDSNSLHMFI